MPDLTEELFGDLQGARYPGSKQTLRSVERAKPKPPADEHAWDHKPRMLMVGGAEHEFFTIGQLAQALNRKPVTIRSWESNGVIPKARYRDQHKRRLYSRRQVEGLCQIAADENCLDFDVRPDKITPAFTTKAIALFKEPL
jgi:hypothetical protein